MTDELMWIFVGTITEREIRSVWRLTSCITAFPSSDSVWTSIGFNVHFLVEQLTSHHVSYDMAMIGVCLFLTTHCSL